MDRKKKTGTEKHAKKKNAEISRKPPIREKQQENVLLPAGKKERQALEKILEIILKSSRVDFSHYRQTTILRRLTRRMHLSKKSSFSEYLHFLESNPDKLQQLYDDLLLSFTEFFRDPYVFEKLKREIYPKLVKGRSVKSPLRIWVPGCSTGQEVYSLAISMYEYLEEIGSNVSLQFFGTDLSEQNIKKARSAVYPEKISSQVSSERLERFFDRDKNGYKVTMHIREMCVFAGQNVTQDPPFPNIDMVSCRNVLIYFDISFQEKTIPMFHFALKPGGYLLLGTSETMSKFGDLFTPVDQDINLYVKRGTGIKPSYCFPTPRGIEKSKGDKTVPVENRSKAGDDDIKKHIDKAVLELYVPPGVLIDDNMDIHRFYGDTSFYLAPASGQASLKLSRMAGVGLMPDIHVGIEEAKKTGKKVRKKNIAFNRNGKEITADICILPIEQSQASEPLFLILFEESETLTEFEGKSAGDPDNSRLCKLERLKDELKATKKHLQTIIEDKEEANQSLWAANEEIQSTNEELQSVNEEMEAAKEELESSNEELLSLNEELRTKNLELLNTQEALIKSEEMSRSIIESSPMGVYVYELQDDDRLVLVGANKSADNMVKVDNSKFIGLTIEEAFPGLADTEIPERYKRAAKYGESWSTEQITYDYGEIHGAYEVFAFKISSGRMAVMFNDITERKQADEALRLEKEFTDTALNSQRDTFFLFDPVKGKSIRWNKAFSDITGYSDQEIADLPVPGSYYSQNDQKRAVAFIGEVMKNGSGSIEMELVCRDGRKIPTEYSVSAIFDEERQTNYLISIGRDISERKRAEQALRESKEFAENLLETANMVVVTLDSRANIIIFNRHAEELTGHKKHEVIGKNWFDIFIPESDKQLIPRVFQDTLKNMADYSEYENPIVTKDGLERLISWRNSVLKNSFGVANGILSIGIDVTDRKEAENALRESEARLREAQELARLGNWFWDVNTGQVDWSDEVYKIFRLDPNEFTPQIDSILELSPWPEDHQRDKELIQKAVENHESGSYQQKFLRPDGSIGYYSSTFQGIYDRDDSLIAIKGTIQDITEQKTVEIERETLLKTLTAKNKELQSIVYVASHDLKSPLVNISGFGSELVSDCNELKGLLENVDLNNDIYEQVNTIINEHIPCSVQYIISGTDKMKLLLDGLLQVSRVGTASLNIEPLDMNQVIKQVVESDQYKAKEIGAVITVDELPMCAGDIAMVSQVFSNLLGNALKYLDPDRPGRIRIYTLDDNEKSVYCVEDNGIGIAANHIGKIFEVFHRLDPNDSVGGEGLGLSIVSRALDRLDGSIWVESEPGRGSRFIVSLPKK